MPRVSVIVPCYNAEQYVGRTLASLLRQTLTAWECIVVDDGSTDDSAAVVRECAETDARIRLIRQRNGGVCTARNAGYRQSIADSDYLLFLDADDVLAPNMLASLSEYLDTHTSVGLAYCQFRCVDTDDRPLAANDPRIMRIERYVPTRLGVRVLPSTVAETPFDSIFGVWAGLLPSNSLVRRSVYSRISGWDESLGQPSDDTDLFLQVALQCKVHYVARTLVDYRRHASQSTSSHARIVTQDRKLYRKWAHEVELSPYEQSILAHAQWFREARLMPYLWLKWGFGNLQHHRIGEAGKCLLRALRQVSMTAITLEPAIQGDARA